MDIRFNRHDNTYTIRLDDYGRTEKTYQNLKTLMIDRMNHSRKEVKMPAKNLVVQLYTAWYEMYDVIDMSINKIVSVDEEDFNKLSTLYNYIFHKSDKMCFYRDHYKSFKDYNDFFKNTFNFNIEEFKEANPANFI